MSLEGTALDYVSWHVQIAVIITVSRHFPLLKRLREIADKLKEIQHDLDRCLLLPIHVLVEPVEFSCPERPPHCEGIRMMKSG